jgi:DNA-binding IclR family transcriptional regulator
VTDVQEDRVPPQHHRTVDRVVAVLEHIAREPRGLTLTDLAKTIGAPTSSLQGLVYGLVATGYLTERGKRYFVGPAPFMLTLLANPVAARSIDHQALVSIQERLHVSVVVAIQVGDSYVAIDSVTDDAPLNFHTRTHHRGPLVTSAMGKTILANLSDADMHAYLLAEERQNSAGVAAFLSEVNEIRKSGLAFNRGKSLAGGYAVATPLFDHDGRVVAAIGAVGNRDINGRLQEIGHRLRAEVANLRASMTPGDLAG